MATIKNLLSNMIGKINENTSNVKSLSDEIADLKAKLVDGNEVAY